MANLDDEAEVDDPNALIESFFEVGSLGPSPAPNPMTLLPPPPLSRAEAVELTAEPAAAEPVALELATPELAAVELAAAEPVAAELAAAEQASAAAADNSSRALFVTLVADGAPPLTAARQEVLEQQQRAEVAESESAALRLEVEQLTEQLQQAILARLTDHSAELGGG
jgi:hypothetical protein